MNLIDAVKSGFSKYVGFSGRARRSEFWFWTLFNFLVGLVASGLDNAAGMANSTGNGPIGTIVTLALLLPSLSVFWRRMHDTGRSGLWFFLGLIPLVGLIVLIVFACQDSQPGQNQHGPNPKGIGGGYGEFPGQPPQFGGPSQYGQPGQF
ncbi:DUF805 domain-containing protein [Kineococcus sp. GCM10028916]|uniref:DUF805 domain-containing protein n=1 Tax=Kineococcus sp. GCM10028916 TaxID=3273394 RepID=UPI003627F6A3